MDTPQIITKIYDLILYLLPQISKFPRSQKYLLGDRLEMTVLDVMELLIEATYSRDKGPLLRQTNVKLEKARYYVRLCKDMKRIDYQMYNILEPIFDPTFIYDSYATRWAKGTHAAINRFQEFARINPYVLKCDIRQYFPSINHEVLVKLIERKIACPDTLWLIKTNLESHRKYDKDGTCFAASQLVSL